MPAIFGDHMVLQAGERVNIWGWADDGEKVTVTFRGQKATTVAKDGKWMVSLKKMKAGGPGVLTVAGKNSIQFDDVVVGEVWVCSGQSNMEFALRNSYEVTNDIIAATNTQIRLFLVAKSRLDEPTNDVKGSWQVCSPNSAQWFSAVAYYFGRDLQRARKVPVGLIGTYWGGSPAEVWMRQDMLENNPRYKKEILDTYTPQGKRYEVALAKYKTEKAEAEKNQVTFEKRPPGQPWKPAELYNGMIAPLTNYTIRGALWYQGEANAGRAEQYRTLFPDMIRNWRADWREGNFPFLLVQLAPFQRIKNEPAESAWAELREAQLYSTQILPKVGEVVITDVGNPDNIHPTKKEPVGDRLALAAQGIAYGERIVYSGPIYQKLKVRGDKAIVSFTSAGHGLETRDGELKGFAICGEDHKFVWANAVIDGKDKVIVSSPEVAHPVAVRYGWADCPVVNLWNRDGLPATPFRTDNFPMVTAGK